MRGRVAERLAESRESARDAISAGVRGGRRNARWCGVQVEGLGVGEVAEAGPDVLGGLAEELEDLRERVSKVVVRLEEVEL